MSYTSRRKLRIDLSIAILFQFSSLVKAHEGEEVHMIVADADDHVVPFPPVFRTGPSAWRLAADGEVVHTDDFREGAKQT